MNTKRKSRKASPMDLADVFPILVAFAGAVMVAVEFIRYF